ncbi:MAG: hypothetical protein UY04_C0001G0030 [Parcubacteria group bacterium GW2011_GWA2_47_7]|nr:MAG: hypothetical protein UY04_C0001G0030 [Parcubacteria group bacterium GW2011_GWA2_47_7]
MRSYDAQRGNYTTNFEMSKKAISNDYTELFKYRYSYY